MLLERMFFLHAGKLIYKGFRLIDQRNLRCHFIVDQNAMEDFEGVNTSDPNAVVVGLAPEKFEYDNMNEAFRLLLDGTCL